MLRSSFSEFGCGIACRSMVYGGLRIQVYEVGPRPDMVPRAGARASLSGATRLGKPSRSDAIAVAAYKTGVAAVTAPHSSSALCAGRWRGAQLVRSAFVRNSYIR